MVKLCLMASHGYHPELGVVLPTEQGFGMGSKDFHHFLPYRGSNQDLVNSNSLSMNLKQKEEWKFTGGLLDCNQFVKIDSISKRPTLIDVQDTLPDSKMLSLGIAERFTRQEAILKLFATGSIQAGDGLLDLSMLYDLMRPQQIGDFPQELFSNSRWRFNDTESEKSLIYPTKELYFNEVSHHPDGPFNCSTNELSDILSVISELYLSNNTIKSSKPTMLVPYFERRRRAKANINSSKLVTEKVGHVKSHEKMKEKTAHKKKKTHTRIERDNSYLHACESLLSILFDRNQQQGKSTILSLKKSGPQLPQLLTQFSASIAGTGIAVVLYVLYRVACNRVPFCGSKLLSTGLGLGLLSLSWAVNKLRETVVCITRSSGKLGGKEEEMMNHLEINLKDVYFRAAALTVVAVLRLV